jgi:hypothetical protein
MIIRMTSTGRRQRRYDHRLRDLVQRTGNVTIATDLGVPRSTARRGVWPIATRVDVVTVEQPVTNTDTDSTDVRNFIGTAELVPEQQWSRTAPGADASSNRMGHGDNISDTGLTERIVVRDASDTLSPASSLQICKVPKHLPT